MIGFDIYDNLYDVLESLEPPRDSNISCEGCRYLDATCYPWYDDGKTPYPNCKRIEDIGSAWFEVIKGRCIHYHSIDDISVND